MWVRFPLGAHNNMPVHLRPQLLDEIRQLAARHHVDKVILYGSRARGDHRQRSDIDLAVTGGDKLNFYYDLDEKTSTLLSFDLADLDSHLSQDFLSEINRDGITIYEKT